jgi:hypothetical protein
MIRLRPISWLLPISMGLTIAQTNGDFVAKWLN